MSRCGAEQPGSQPWAEQIFSDQCDYIDSPLTCKQRGASSGPTSPWGTLMSTWRLSIPLALLGSLTIAGCQPRPAVVSTAGETEKPLFLNVTPGRGGGFSFPHSGKTQPPFILRAPGGGGG